MNVDPARGWGMSQKFHECLQGNAGNVCKVLLKDHEGAS